MAYAGAKRRLMAKGREGAKKLATLLRCEMPASTVRSKKPSQMPPMALPPTLTQEPIVRPKSTGMEIFPEMATESTTTQSTREETLGGGHLAPAGDSHGAEAEDVPPQSALREEPTAMKAAVGSAASMSRKMM
jgi:hypothetical protein